MSAGRRTHALVVAADQAIAVATDTLVEAVHFLPGTAPQDVAWKALAVNLSDLAAMGARPVEAHVVVRAPRGHHAWTGHLRDGLEAAASALGVDLAAVCSGAGETQVSVTVLGTLPRTSALTRAGARPGDVVWATGTLGDAGLALAALRGEASLAAAYADELRLRLDRPTPRIAAGIALRGIAHAAIDVSDGFAQDLGHVLRASALGAEVHIDRVPLSAGMRASVDRGRAIELALSAGDDYELCFTAPPGATSRIEHALRTAGTPAQQLGEVTGEPGLRLVDARGERVPWSPGYAHFTTGEMDR